MGDIKNPISKDLLTSMNQYATATESAAASLDKLITEGNKLIEANNKLATSQDNNKKKRETLTAVEKESLKIRNSQIQVHAKLETARTQAAKSLDKSKIELQEQNKVRKEAIKLEKTQVGSISRLRAENKKLRAERDKLNLTTDEGRKQLLKLNSAIDKNDDKIKKSTDSYTKQKIEVGNYKDNIKDALKEQDFFGVSTGKLTTLFTTATGAIGAGVAILGGLAKAYASSARGAEDLARASDRLASISRQTGNAIADSAGEVGLLDKLLANLQATYLGAASAAASNAEVILRSRLRQMEVEEIDQERQKKAQLDRTEQLRQTRDEERNSFEERKAANDELGEIINKRESETIAFQEKRLKIYKDLLKFDKGNLELQKQIKTVEFEIADAKEEARGFESEQKINDLALFKEVSEAEIELSQKQIAAEILLAEEGSREKFALETKLIENTRTLQVKAAGDNKQLREIAIQEADNQQRALTIAFKKGLDDREKEYESFEAIITSHKAEELKYRIDLEDDFEKKSLDGLKKSSEAKIKAAQDEAKARIELQEMIKDATIDLSAQGAQAVSDVLFEAASQQRDEELERLDEQREEDLERVETEQEEDLASVQDKLDLGLINEDQAAAQRTAINQRAAAEKEKIEEDIAKKEAAIKTKQAKADRAAALIGVAIDTAVGIANAASKVATIPLIPFIAATGAIQAATILATPIPKFATGTDSTPSGNWIAGEAGREMILSPNGQMFLTPDKATLYSDMPNHQVIPHAETQAMLSGVGGFKDSGIRNDLQKLIKVSKQNRSRTVDNTETTKRGNRMIKLHRAFKDNMRS
jgi:hypothetical protein